PPRHHATFTCFPYTTLFRSRAASTGRRGPVAGPQLRDQLPDPLRVQAAARGGGGAGRPAAAPGAVTAGAQVQDGAVRSFGDRREDRKSTRLNSSHVKSSYAD